MHSLWKCTQYGDYLYNNDIHTGEGIPQFYVNKDLDSVVTLVKVDRLVELLKASSYPEHEIQFLEQGFRDGFDIGYKGPTCRQSQSDNIPFTVGNKTVLWNKLMKEVKLNRVAGTFETIPFDNYIQSPIGLEYQRLD